VGVTALLFLLADLFLTWWNRTSGVVIAQPEAVRGNWIAPIKTALGQIWRLPELRRGMALAAGLNFVFGVTLATSAAMVTGLYGQSEQSYALLQTAGTIATIVILTLIANVIIPLRTLGAVSYVAIFLGGILTAVSSSYWVYAAGFILVIGFDKMFNVYIRSLRQKVIPPKDFGKTTGVMITLNNLSQPVAGLMVSLFSGSGQLGAVIGGITLVMGGIGVAVALSSSAPLRERA
jgi:hypothetical protein